MQPPCHRSSPRLQQPPCCPARRLCTSPLRLVPRQQLHQLNQGQPQQQAPAAGSSSPLPPPAPLAAALATCPAPAAPAPPAPLDIQQQKLALPQQLPALSGHEVRDVAAISIGVQHVLRRLLWPPVQRAQVLQVLLLKRKQGQVSSTTSAAARPPHVLPSWLLALALAHLCGACFPQHQLRRQGHLAPPRPHQPPGHPHPRPACSLFLTPDAGDHVRLP
jgi:hypothetical protein